MKGRGTGLGRALHLEHLGISEHGTCPVPDWVVGDVAVGAGVRGCRHRRHATRSSPFTAPAGFR
ncbi:hypothetical protein [Streptomyces flaveolus]|uniref:hypothetical protein n=1 Tax=Streptomyces flaveolus TaxID=67297 RepID=UPI00332AF965